MPTSTQNEVLHSIQKDVVGESVFPLVQLESSKTAGVAVSFQFFFVTMPITLLDLTGSNVQNFGAV